MLALYISMLETGHERNKMTELYEEHRYALLMYALKVTNNNQAMAEDAVHNAFLSIIKEKENIYIWTADFRALSVIIVRNKCIDLLRKEKPYADITMDELEIYLESKENPLMSRPQFTRI